VIPEPGLLIKTTPGTYQARAGEQVKTLAGGRNEIYDPASKRTVTTNQRGEVKKIEASTSLYTGGTYR